jgi:ribonuclease-3
VIKRLYVPILDHIDPRTLGKDAKTLLQEYLQGHKIALPTYTVVATHGAAHNQQFEVECTVPKLDVKVSGSGASRRAAEQAAAKKALDEVMAAAPAVVGKSKRSKAARAAKNAQVEIVPGVTGVQAALDLRSPERKHERSAARGEPRAAAAAELSPERPAAERAASAVGGSPLAVIRAAHVEYSGQEKAERAEKAEKSAVDKPTVPANDRSADKATTDKPAEAKTEAAPLRSAERQRAREAAPGAAVAATPAIPAATEHEPGVVDAVQTRVADAGH